MAYSDVSAGQVIFMNVPRALMSFAGLLLYNKTIDLFVRLISQRDFFQSGHLQFVHSLREGLVVVDDVLENNKLFNVAARQMLQLPFQDDDEDSSTEGTIFLEQIELKRIELG